MKDSGWLENLANEIQGASWFYLPITGGEILYKAFYIGASQPCSSNTSLTETTVQPLTTPPFLSSAEWGAESCRT